MTKKSDLDSIRPPSWLDILMRGRQTASPIINSCYRSILSTLNTVNNGKLKAMVREMIHFPLPRCIQFMRREERERAAEQLLHRGYIRSVPEMLDLFERIIRLARRDYVLLAPGSDSFSHNSYPGGLVVHIYFNLQNALSLIRCHRRIPRLRLNRDNLVCAIISHDLVKALTLPWDEDFQLPTEPKIARTKAHHVLAIAEAMYRKMPPSLIQYIAAIHAKSVHEKDIIVDYIRAAEILSGVNAVEYGILSNVDRNEMRLRGGISTSHMIANTSEQGIRGMTLEQSSRVDAEIRHFLGNKYHRLDDMSTDVVAKLIRFFAPDFVLHSILTEDGPRQFESTLESIITDQVTAVLQLWQSRKTEAKSGNGIDRGVLVSLLGKTDNSLPDPEEHGE